MRSLLSFLPLPARTKPFENRVFVTGVARSGTTFLGWALSRDWRTAYIHEPFSNVGIEGVDWQHVELDPETLVPQDPSARAAIEKLLRLQVRQPNNINWNERFPLVAMKCILGSRGPFSLTMAKWNRNADYLIVKDPDAFCFASYLQKELGFKVIVTVRHPVAIWSSYKRIGWPGFIADRLRSAAFVKHYEDDDIALLESVNSSTPEHIQYAISWRLGYRYLHATLASNTSAKFITTEELSSDPDQIATIAKEMQIPWSVKSDEWVKQNTTASGRVHPPANQVQDLRRDSSKIFESSIKSITEQHRNEIQEITWPVASLFYSKTHFFD
ncbi:MAG: hypothetical protein NTW52_07885 [Planctomycetota bacterium]|nr:hypothetical protein [Planctomycetota bacterium]